MIRVLVVADIRLFRDGIVNYLRRQPRFAVAATAAGAREAIAYCTTSPPDVALIDLALGDSLEAIRAIVAVAPTVRVVAIGVPDDPKAVIACAEAGVAGFVRREESLDDLAASLDSVARDELRITPRLAATLLRHLGTLARGQPETLDCTVLTARETQIVKLIEEGSSNKEIAARLHIELATVKNHVHNILEKLGVQRRSEVSARLHRTGVTALPTVRSKDLDRGIVHS